MHADRIVAPTLSNKRRFHYAPVGMSLSVLDYENTSNVLSKKTWLLRMRHILTSETGIRRDVISRKFTTAKRNCTPQQTSFSSQEFRNGITAVKVDILVGDKLDGLWL
jgi:hypothetical protein